MISESLTSKSDILRSAFSLAEDLSRHESEKGWYTWTDRASYDINFNCLLDSINIREIAQERRNQGKRSYGLDVMGYGAQLRRLELDGGLSIALTDPRTPQLKEADILLNQQLIVGDFQSTKTKKLVKSWLDDQHPATNGFTFEFFRPLEGITSVANDLTVQFMILNRYYRFLSRDGGILLAQMPISCWLIVPKYVEFLNQFPGLYATYAEPIIEGLTLPWMALKLERSEGSPEELPVMEN